MADEKRENRRPQRRQAEDDGLIKKLIEINRVSKTVKGGKNARFAALVVVGDGKGKVGVGTGKAKEVPEAIDKATLRAKKNMIAIPVVEGTIPHQILGKFGRGAVLMMPASQGTGVIAGGPVRAVMEAAGIKNIRTKSHGTQNPGNCVKATVAGLADLKTAEQVAALRGKTVEEIMCKLGGGTMAKIKVTLVKSTIGEVASVKDTVRALGLKKIRSFKELEDSPTVQGMIKKVRHLVKVENI